MSPEPSSVDIIKRFRLTRMENGLHLNYTFDSQASFVSQEESFKHRNIKDVQYDYKVMNELQGLEPEILLHNSDSQPWYASQTYYYMFSFLLMGWLYRILFILNSQQVKFDFTKIILS